MTPLEQLLNTSWVDQGDLSPNELAALRTRRSVHLSPGRQETFPIQPGGVFANTAETLFGPEGGARMKALKMAGMVPAMLGLGLYDIATLGPVERYVKNAMQDYVWNNPQPGDTISDGDRPDIGKTNFDLSMFLLGALAMGASMPRAAVGTNTIGRSSSEPQAPLPMDTASRMARARDMGFVTQTPLAHGTSQEFGAFDPLKLGATTEAGPARLGVWTEVLEPGVPANLAAEFSKLSQSRTRGYPQTYPLLHRTSKPGVIVLPPEGMSVRQMEQTLQQALADGFDAITIKNYSMPGGRLGDILLVKDPAQLRSPFAAFDPAKRDSTDLLAGIALPAVSGPLGALMMSPDARQ